MSLIINLYKKLFIKRYDEQDHLKYYRISDFKNFKSEDFSINYNDNKIKGNFYFYDDYKKDELIIFLHGIGGGRSSYLKEIEHISRLGYKVLAYDYLGCAESEGENIRSIHESIPLLIEVINSLRKDKKYKDIKINLIGHSWGAFTAINSLNYIKNINAVIAISGFLSMSKLVNSFIPKFLSFINKKISKYENDLNPNYANTDGYTALKNTKAKILIIQDKNDNLVKYKDNAEFLQNNLNKKDVYYMITENRFHNPYYTEEAVKFMNNIFTTYNKLVKQHKIKNLEDKIKFKNSIDLEKMTEHSNDVFDRINKFLKEGK